MKANLIAIVLGSICMASCQLASANCHDYKEWNDIKLNNSLIVPEFYIPLSARDVHVCTEEWTDRRQFIRFTVPSDEVDAYVLSATGGHLRDGFDGFIGYEASDRWDWWLDGFDPALQGAAGLDGRFGDIGGLSVAVMSQGRVSTIWLRLETN